MAKRFPAKTLAALAGTKYLKIRAGAEHRFVAIWVVEVEGRVFARSWNDKPTGWFRAFLNHGTGALLVDEKEIPVRARKVASVTILDAMERAYAEKYDTKANEKYVTGFKTVRRRNASVEFLPA